MLHPALALPACLLLVPTTMGWWTPPPPPNPEIVYLDKGIRVMNADGSNKTLVIANVGSGSYLNNPDWSANGQKVVFTGLFNGVQGIWTVNLDGSNRTLVTPAPQSFSGNNPKWSPSPAPDGQEKILFTELVNGQNDVFLVNVNGTGRQNLTNSPAVDESWANWGGDGTRVVVIRNNNDELAQLDLGMVGASIGILAESTLATAGAGHLASPSWANAHDWVTYVEFTMASGYRAMILDMTQLPLTPHQLLSSPTGDERWPSFSPDDSRLTFSRNGAICVANNNGTGLVEIARKGSHPSWKR